MLPEKKPPTHTLTITVPLNFDANPAAETWDIQGAFRQAVDVLLRLAQLGTLGLICGDIEVSVVEQGGQR